MPASSELSNTELESVLIQLVSGQKGLGGILIIMHPGERAELVAALPPNMDSADFAAQLHKLADEVASGSGMSMGNHLKSGHL